MVSDRPTRERRLELELMDDDGLEGRGGSNVLIDGDGVAAPFADDGRGADSDPPRTGGVGSGLVARNDLEGGVLYGEGDEEEDA